MTYGVRPMWAAALLLLLVSAVHAETIVIRELQVVEVEHGTRPILEIDAVERAIAAGNWQTEFSKTVQAGDDDWFRDDALTRNYLVADVVVEEDGVWLLEAMAYGGVYVNGEPRVGNVYGYKDKWESWEPKFNYSFLPVPLRAGSNQLVFYGVRWGRMRASLTRAAAPLSFNARDLTLPDLVVGETSQTWGAVPVLNATGETVDDAVLVVRGPDEGYEERLALPVLPPHGTRKVAFPLQAQAHAERKVVPFELDIVHGGDTHDTVQLLLAVKEPGDNRRVTFRSALDNSVQYYGYLPPTGEPGPKALVLSLHGAAVEAINQTGSYQRLNWAHIVAPTNRRPFGFDWENWGRFDAFEVLDLNLQTHDILEDRIYLTGHSMGGHGTWHLATLYPDRWAAAGPSAGWITYWSYRRDPPADVASPLKDMLARASSTSQTIEKARNLESLGLYILHGAEDDNVPPEQSHLMVEALEPFHRNFIYHEEPDVGHWFDYPEEPGAECVTWAPMFDFFVRHRAAGKSEVRDIRFMTPSPGVSSWNHWVGIARQERVFEMSRVEAHRDPHGTHITATTGNVEVLGFDVATFAGDSIRVTLDDEEFHRPVPEDGILWFEHQAAWTSIDAVDVSRKHPGRYGGFRDVFYNNVQLVVGTRGSAAETAWAWAKARYDAEYLWYQGNASLDVIADTDFDPAAATDRNVILYGNADTHEDWAALVPGAVQVHNGRLTWGTRTLSADDLGILAIRPRPGSDTASVGLVSGTGLAGLRLTERRPYVKGGFAYPDVTVLEDRGDGTVVRGAGFFGNDWSLDKGEFVWVEEF